MAFDLRSRVALVTGSSTGLGKAIAMELAAAGAKVAMNFAHNQQRALDALEELRSRGGQANLYRADVTDPAAVEQMVQQVRRDLGPVDIIVANATVSQPQKHIEDYDWAFYQTMLDFFVKSPVLLIKACLADMKARKFGRVVQITSEVFQEGTSPFSAYVAAKGGQTGLTRSLARELAPFGITVNNIAPGWIPVERHANDPQTAKDAYLATIPARRWGVPADVAHAVRYLASEEASFVTGQTLTVDGGRLVS